VLYDGEERDPFAVPAQGDVEGDDVHRGAGDRQLLGRDRAEIHLSLMEYPIVSVDSSDLPLTILIALIFIRLCFDAACMAPGSLLLPIAFWIGCLWIAIGLLGSFACTASFTGCSTAHRGLSEHSSARAMERSSSTSD